jgi:glycosyltransferase involved in cell wall biosynthesis
MSDDGQGVSVIIPTRNRPTLLREAIASLLGQTRPVDQIIVVDDASEAPDWLPGIQDLSSSIEVVRRPRHGGVSAARNAGLDRARGKYVVFLDDDDLLDARMVEHGVDVLESQGAASGVFFRHQTVIHDDVDRLDPSRRRPAGNRASLHMASADNPVPRSTLTERPVTAFLRYLIPIHSGLIRRAAVDATRFPEELRQGEDTYFWISMAAAGRRFVLDERAYAIVRRHAQNTTRLRSRYIADIQPCYERLLADGLLASADDAYLAHLKLLWFKTLTGHATRPHLVHVGRSPHRLAAELGFWTANLTARFCRSLRPSARGPQGDDSLAILNG